MNWEKSYNEQDKHLILLVSRSTVYPLLLNCHGIEKLLFIHSEIDPKMDGIMVSLNKLIVVFINIQEDNISKKSHEF